MKKLLGTVFCTVFFGCFFGKAQTLSLSPVNSTAGITTNPNVNLSQFEIRGNKLITHNFFSGTAALPLAQKKPTQTASGDYIDYEEVKE